jgi:DNA-binding HxlR family transcriptional regulator
VNDATAAGDDGGLQHLRDLLHWLSQEWEPDILVALSAGPLRYVALLEAIRSRTIVDGWNGRHRRDIADSTLNRTLRKMERDSLVERARDESVFPPMASYHLTPVARQLLEVLRPATDWIGEHPEVIDRVQRNRREDASESTPDNI